MADNTDKAQLDFERIERLVDEAIDEKRKQKEALKQREEERKAEENNQRVSITINGTNRVAEMPRKKPSLVQMPVINKEDPKPDKKEEPKEEPKKNNSSSVKFDYEKMKAESIGTEELPEVSRIVKVTKEELEKLKGINIWIKRSIAVLLVAVSIGLVSAKAVKEYKDYTYESAISLNAKDLPTITNTRDFIADVDLEEVGRNIAKRIKTEIEQYNALKRDYDASKQFKLYLGVAYNKLVDKITLDKSGAYKAEFGDYVYSGWMPIIYHYACVELKDTLELPENLKDYLKENYVVNYEDNKIEPNDALQMLGDEAKIYEKASINPAYEAEKEYERQIEEQFSKGR